ncbi:uncharacterized protein BDW43DRAFT_306734 [Aspergillus alliaceus]|uniref:uncharacterized protein n=1 Tax=Petromyces alliaceus TaxID=209559 RepID=UPI0012A70E36|nr:uncharacterized protein BDW43DRAFT_306734 [Aspergillus alliaceus]KAB8238035.1 hypothetical protein BDW43DRAFT_306734 [Aspergillus alliaceus]
MPTSKPAEAFNQTRAGQAKKLESFVKELKAVFGQALPRHGSYKNVTVIAFHWDNNQMRVTRLEVELLDIFKPMDHAWIVLVVRKRDINKRMLVKEPSKNAGDRKG